MEFAFNGNTYRAGTIPAMQQFHVARRLAPALEKLLVINFSAFGPRSMDIGNFEGDLRQVLGPILDAAACLPDEDVEYVVNTCLNAVEMRQPGGAWAPVRHAGAIMFPIDLPVMLLLTFRCIEANLAGFTKGLPWLSPGAGQESSASG